MPTAGEPSGRPGSRVRGVCYYYPTGAKEVGVFRYLQRIDGNLWLRDDRPRAKDITVSYRYTPV